MKFAFLVHPLSEDTSRLLDFTATGGLRRSIGADLSRFLYEVHSVVQRWQTPAPAENREVRVIDELPGLDSRTGQRTEGRLYQVPMDALAILADPARALEYMRTAVDAAAAWGAGIVGLGSMTGVIAGQGAELAQSAPIPVTTGNSLTVYAAVRNVLAACEAVEVDLAEATVAVVGVPGSIATAIARIVRPKCRTLIVASRRPSSRVTAIAEELEAEALCDLPAALARAGVVFTATSSGGCIEQGWLRPGAILSDIGVPTDVLGSRPLRHDCLILTGGLARVPETMSPASNYLWFHRGMIPSCLGETMVLGLDGLRECFSLGRSLDPERIGEIGRRAEEHGFNFAQLHSFGLPLEESALVRFRKALARCGRPRRTGPPGTTAGDGESPLAPLAGRAAERFSRHINPITMSVAGSVVKTFVKGEGTRLWDAEGRACLDFIGGDGSLALGHNHPEVAAAVEATLRHGAPGLTPAAVNPLAAALAEQLAELAPGGLEMVWLVNDGAEAVEAALRLARRVTSRSGFLYCEGASHGQSRLLAPSAEGQPVPLGDVDVLRRALATRQFAALAVEPVQSEGGMRVAPDDYLQAAAQLCRETETLLVVDEAQTGLGWTGAMFAVERLGIEPDVLTLAGALGGGVASLGAMLTRRDLWMRAYGSLDSFALHTGVLAGGSLACAAALATLEVLRRGELVANARARGEELTSGLRALGERYPLFREVRGRGLLIGVELLPSRESIFSQLQHLLAGDAAALALPGLTPLLANITAPYLATVLLRAHGICTQLAGPGVLRVQPPLVVTADEVAEFLRAMDAACGEVQSLAMSFDRIVAKSGLGQRSPQAAPSAPAEAPPRPAIPAPSVGGNGHKPATAAKTLTGHGQH